MKQNNPTVFCGNAEKTFFGFTLIWSVLLQPWPEISIKDYLDGHYFLITLESSSRDGMKSADGSLPTSS